MDKPTIKSMDELFSRIRLLRKDIKRVRYLRRHPEMVPEEMKGYDWNRREADLWAEISRVGYCIGADAERLSSVAWARKS